LPLTQRTVIRMLSLTVIDSETLRVKTSIVGGSFLLAGSASGLDENGSGFRPSPRGSTASGTASNR
jgi:hypothetical protein